METLNIAEYRKDRLEKMQDTFWKVAHMAHSCLGRRFRR